MHQKRRSLAFDANNLQNGPLWSFPVGTTENFNIGADLAAPIWDSTSGTLFVAGNQLVRQVNGVHSVSSKGVEEVAKAFEAPGVEPVFPTKDDVISYAQTRARFRTGEIRVLDSTGNVERTIAFN